MLIAIGTDIIDCRRLEAAMRRHGEKLIQRLFTSVEQAYADNAKTQERRLLRYANRYAAKEAFIKAVSGRGKAISWQDISIINATNGTPSLHVLGNAHDAALSMLPTGITDYALHLSLSDEYPYCVAFVTLSSVP